MFWRANARNFCRISSDRDDDSPSYLPSLAGIVPFISEHRISILDIGAAKELQRNALTKAHIPA